MTQTITVTEFDQREAKRLSEAEPDVSLTLPWPPSLNRMVRRSGKLVHVSQEATTYKALAGWKAREQGCVDLLQGNLSVTLRLYRPRMIGDIDNYSKSLLDSLSGVVWVDDSQIVEMHVYRLDDRLRPRVELDVYSREREDVP